MKRIKFGTTKPKTFSASPGVKKFADTSFDFGHNAPKKKGKGGGGGRKRKPPAGGGS